MSVVLLGTGTCRLSAERIHTSACIELGESLLLIDVGVGALHRLAEGGFLRRCQDLHIHISHRHIDHLLGLFALLQSLTWSDDLSLLRISQVTIHCTKEVEQLITAVRSVWGEAETSLVGLSDEPRNLRIQSGDDFGDWEYSVAGTAVRSIHLPAVNNHGALVEVDGVRYGFTADATELNGTLISFCQNADIVVFDAGHLSNKQGDEGTWQVTDEPLVALATAAQTPILVAAHMYLRHLQHRDVTESEREHEVALIIAEANRRARERGYRGQLLVGHDKLCLDQLALQHGLPRRGAA